MADLPEDQREGLLIKVVGQGGILSETAEHQQEAAAETGHELAFGGLITRLDPPDEDGGRIVWRLGSVRNLPPHPSREDERRGEEDDEPV